ncbi:ABC transporter permease [Streptomyces minutiscleroticus]|uniref:ABC transporter permease n=1 Tax=Streptomyces minutiscleroticus TaxID=68238 RepID=UPI00167E3BD0|nr:ABC transporter permease [Streptomyces minutiscleroticus]
MRTDLRLAWLLTRGSDRREGWRALLTALGAALATAFALAAVAVASVRGQVRVPYAAGLLNHPGERSGVVLVLVLLLVPVLGFLGQCARIGAVHRDRRLAGLRLAGAAPGRVRRIAALETGLACMAGTAVTAVFGALLLLRFWHRPPLVLWAGFAAVALCVPVLASLVGAVALRRVVASPLGWVRRERGVRGRGRALALVLPVLPLGAAGLLQLVRGPGAPSSSLSPVLAVFGAVALTGVGAVGTAGATARATGRWLGRRTGGPAVLIAAARLRADPWAAARTHAAVLLVTVVGVGFVGVREVLLEELHRDGRHYAADLDFYTTGIDLAGAAVLVALLIGVAGVAVGTAESLATRRRGLAAQHAAGVPRGVLVRALLLETALPLVPALLPATAGGTAVYVGYGALHGAGGVSPLPLLVPAAVLAGGLLAAATSLPLLRRSLHPAELRFT